MKIDGKQIYYEEYGAENSPTLIYLHGGPGESCLTYTYQAQKLGAYFHVISYDQYGVFRSDAIPEEQEIDVKYHVDMIEQYQELDTDRTFIWRNACSHLCTHVSRQY
jgi:proline iminopeptidase